jgi:hypothetical protein
MSIDVSWYDVTALDWAADSLDDGAILQSTTNTWKPLAQEFKKVRFSERQNRLEHRGNQQTLSIDQRTKKWLEVQFEYIAEKYDSNSPAYGWWDLINQAFYGGATGSPALRPGTAWLAAKINRATPEYWLAFGAKIESVVIKGSMTEGPMTITINAIARGHQFKTTNYIQGTATRRTALTKNPIIPSNDVTITVNAVDVTSIVDEFTLTLSRKYEKKGRSATTAESSTQVGVSGYNYREFVPSDFDGRLELTLQPYGTTTAQLIDYLADTALGTVSISAENATNGKTITFSASKTKGADQEHAEGVAPSSLSLIIDGSTFNVTTN